VICRFTTGDPGSLCLDLSMHLVELVPGERVHMHDQLVLPVTQQIALRSLMYGQPF
jgi:hypothetical protein